MVVDLQHEVYYLNNQLHPLLNEEEDLEMLVEDDGWEKEDRKLQERPWPQLDENYGQLQMCFI